MTLKYLRAPFDPSLEPLRGVFLTLIPRLEIQPDWYGSIYFERKSQRTLSANLKQTQVSDQVSTGVVLRIYNGATLFEQATDDLDPSNLNKLADDFARRVAATPLPDGVKRRPYRAPTWRERLSAELEPEITSQIPAGVSAQTPVHFGIRYSSDPRAATTDATIAHLQAIVSRVQGLSGAHGFETGEISFVLARHSFADEESIFVDRESNLSQTIYRLALTVVAMSGGDRTMVRTGGLGGLEALKVEDKELNQILDELSRLKKAELLKPGKYRVVLGPQLTGVLAHEAFGHAQEADTCARGRSKAWEIHLEQKNDPTIRVGNEHATILNNPAIFENGEEKYAAWGSMYFDEEGWLAQSQVLLDRGVLKAPMTNLTSALRLGIPRTANGKRESWANGVYTRQTNTYFSAGTETLDDLISKVDDGFIAMQVAGGMEDPKGMGIQVGIAYLHEVKNGKPTGRFFKGPAGGDIQLTGYVPDVLSSIIGKSKIEAQTSSPDQSRHPINEVGGCGKYHKEVVHAGCGGTYLLLDQVVLG